MIVSTTTVNMAEVSRCLAWVLGSLPRYVNGVAIHHSVTGAITGRMWTCRLCEEQVMYTYGGGQLEKHKEDHH